MGFQNWGLDYKNPCFIKYADSYGAKGHRIEATEDLAPTLSKCFEEGGVHLVDCPVDYSENDQILNIDIKNLSSKI